MQLCDVVGDDTPPSQFIILLQDLVCDPLEEQLDQLPHDQLLEVHAGI